MKTCIPFSPNIINDNSYYQPHKYRMKRTPSTQVREPINGANPRATMKEDETFGA
jgi:hypothetical protein